MVVSIRLNADPDNILGLHGPTLRGHGERCSNAFFLLTLVHVVDPFVFTTAAAAALHKNIILLSSASSLNLIPKSICLVKNNFSNQKPIPLKSGRIGITDYSRMRLNLNLIYFLPSTQK